MDEDLTPPFTPRELGQKILRYYQFLTTLYVDEKDLRIPPPSGWPQFTNDFCANFKSPLALETLRHLPFIQGHYSFDWHSFFNNYLDMNHEYFTKPEPIEESMFIGTENWANSNDCLLLVYGVGGTGAVNIALDVKQGALIVDDMEMQINGREIDQYLEDMKQRLLSLRLIPGSVPRTIYDMDMEVGDDVTGEITEQQLLQQDEDWPTKMDLQFVRQVYWDYGWPNHFKRDEAFQVIDRLMVQVEEKDRGGWETVSSC